MSQLESSAVLNKAEAFELDWRVPALDPGVPSFDANIAKQVVRKSDMILSPLFFLVYLITFIDRANVGNARVAGLEKDLGLHGYQYNISLTVFYIFYALWEMPSNIVCKAIGPKIWIPLQVFVFGLICLSTAFVRSFGGFVVVRVLLGLAEGGVLPAMSLVLSRFYTRAELVFRIAIMVSAASLAGAFGGLLASGFIAIGPLNGVGAAWRNIFLLEGSMTIGISVIVYFFVPAEPATAWFLTPEQREVAQLRMGRQLSAVASQPLVEATRTQLIKQAFLHVPTWLCALGYLCTNVSVQGVSLFLPTIIKALYPRLPTVQIQLRTDRLRKSRRMFEADFVFPFIFCFGEALPPYVVAFFWSLALAYLSKRLNRRGFVMLCSSPFALAGYVTFVATDLSDIHARYAAAFLCILGAFPLGPFFLAWAANNSATDTERGIASGVVPGFGQFGAMIATWSYLPNDAPNYYTGNKINIGFVCATWLCTAVTLAWCTMENRKRADGKRDHRLAEATGDEDAVFKLGSRHPAFVYST